MKKTTAAVVVAALAGGLLSIADANAGGRFHRGHFHGARVGVFVGVPPLFYSPTYYSPYYYPPYYYPPTVVVPGPVAAAPVASAPVYIQQQPALEGVPPAATPGGPGSGAYWYFCRDTQTYYPYVKQCASPWERVEPSGAPPA